MKLWDFPRFSFVLQRKMVEFKSLPKCWHAIHDRYEASLRRSKTFISISGDFADNVPVKTAPLTTNLPQL
jgi:hypothetical protein